MKTVLVRDINRGLEIAFEMRSTIHWFVDDISHS